MKVGTKLQPCKKSAAQEEARKLVVLLYICVSGSLSSMGWSKHFSRKLVPGLQQSDRMLTVYSRFLKLVVILEYVHNLRFLWYNCNKWRFKDSFEGFWGNVVTQSGLFRGFVTEVRLVTEAKFRLQLVQQDSLFPQLAWWCIHPNVACTSLSVPRVSLSAGKKVLWLSKNLCKKSVAHIN